MLQRHRALFYTETDKHNSSKLVERVKYLHQEGFSYKEVMAELNNYCDMVLMELFPEGDYYLVQKSGIKNGIAQCLISATNNEYNAKKIGEDLYMQYLRLGMKEEFLEDFMYNTDFIESFNVGVKYFKDNI